MANKEAKLPAPDDPDFGSDDVAASDIDTLDMDESQSPLAKRYSKNAQKEE